MPDPDTRALLAEDDPVSASFLEEALHGMGMDVCVCADGNRALRRASEERFALLLLDCRLPGIGAPDILAALREDAHAASRRTPVLATSAEVTPALEKKLLALGCRGVLHKPLQLAELEHAVRGIVPCTPACLVDDAAGLKASGGVDNLKALRMLFADELDALGADLDGLRAEPVALRERLHRLRASCGFCGALALGEASAQLASQLDADATARERAIARFRDTLDETLGALRTGDASRSA